MKRKIAAILAADVAGYSKLVAADEEATLRQLVASRAVFEELVARYEGRIFSTAGDAVLAEFASAVEAVRAAIDVQRRLKALNDGTAAERSMRFRIGITVGDVVERDGDLLGDGVNVAARLEGLADAGGICVSRSVFEHVGNRVAVRFTDIGPQTVKNIPTPVYAYTIAFDAPEPPPAPKAAAPKARPPVTRVPEALKAKPVAAPKEPPPQPKRVAAKQEDSAVFPLLFALTALMVVIGIIAWRIMTAEPQTAAVPKIEAPVAAPAPAPEGATSAPLPAREVVPPQEVPPAENAVGPPPPRAPAPSQEAASPPEDKAAAVPTPSPEVHPRFSPPPAEPARPAARPPEDLPASPSGVGEDAVRAPGEDRDASPARKTAAPTPDRAKPALDRKRRAALCREIVERAQLGELTVDDRDFLAKECR
jgi:adenylate cyclase